DIGAMKRNRENLEKIDYQLTVGGLLFFGKYSSMVDYIPHFHLDYFNRTGSSDRWSDRVATGDPNYPDLNVFSFFQIVLEKLRMTIQDKFDLTDDYTRNFSTND
ncbi:ATP-dependent DNA helicase RecG, partial [Escherichia coli]